MGVGAYMAMIVVLIFIIGFFVLVVLPKPTPNSGGGNLPPDPSLPAYIKAAQVASTAFAGTTAALTTVVGDLFGDVSTTFGSYDSGQGVSDSAPASLRKSVDDSITTAQGTLKTFAQEAAAFDKAVQGWTVSTTPHLVMREKPSADGLKYDAVKPMGDFLGAEGQLSSLASTWAAAYEAASEGDQCGHSSDCKKGQSCSGGRCTAVMNMTMRRAVNALSSAAAKLKTDGTLNTSPWQKQANALHGQYMALFNHLAGL